MVQGKKKERKCDKSIGLRLRTSILVDVNLVSTAITIQRTKKKKGLYRKPHIIRKHFLVII